MPGRIESYLHSDNTTKNKAGALVRVTCQTDFAAKNEKFIDFTKKVAKWSCGLQTTSQEALFEEPMTGLKELHAELEGELREKIVVANISLMKV